MFKKIIDKIEQATINYTMKHSKPFTYYLNRPDGKCCKTCHTSFNSQTRHFFDDKGREYAYVYTKDRKVTSCIIHEYKNDTGNDYRKTWQREFKIVNNERVLTYDSVAIYNDDGTYTVTENGITKTHKACEGPKQIKDEHGNIIEEVIEYPENNETSHSSHTYDSQNREIKRVLTHLVGDQVKNIYINEDEFDDEGRNVKHTFYSKTNFGTEESTSVDYKMYDKKGRLAHIRTYSNYDRPYLGKGKYTDDTYYRYDEEHNAEITLHEYSNWASKTYYKTETLPNGYTIETYWDVPVWPDKLRRFFGAY